MRSSGLTAALLVLAARLAAQSDCSSVAPVYRRSCDRAVDAYKTLQPLAGIAISGGGPALGTGHTLSWMHRTLPRVRFGNNVTGSDNYEVDTDLAATNVRLAASMRLLLFDVAAGVGVDHYTSTADIYSDGLTHVTVPLANTRQVLFLDAGLDLATAKLVAELGYQSGKDQQLTTNYSEFDPKAGHVFGGIGLRFGF